MAKDRKVKKDIKENGVKQTANPPLTISSFEYKPLPKFKGCTNC